VDGDRGWSALLGIGIAAALIVVGGLLIGWVADRALGTTPILLLVGLLLGVAAASTFLYFRIRDSLNS
jgi:F0F1-type ATP synthase assembly protein I